MIIDTDKKEVEDIRPLSVDILQDHTSRVEYLDCRSNMTLVVVGDSVIIISYPDLLVSELKELVNMWRCCDSHLSRDDDGVFWVIMKKRSEPGESKEGDMKLEDRGLTRVYRQTQNIGIMGMSSPELRETILMLKALVVNIRKSRKELERTITTQLSAIGDLGKRLEEYKIATEAPMIYKIDSLGYHIIIAGEITIKLKCDFFSTDVIFQKVGAKEKRSTSTRGLKKFLSDNDACSIFSYRMGQLDLGPGNLGECWLIIENKLRLKSN